MRPWLAWAALTQGLCFASSATLAPLARATLEQWAGSDVSGSITVRTDDGRSHNCSFTPKTYFEANHKRTRVSAIAAGQPLEILSETSGEPPGCRALIVRVLGLEKALPARRHWERPTIPSSLFVPRGHIVLAGVVTRFTEDVVWIRTRQGERHRLLLRPDTRFAESGHPVDRSALRVNCPVQIRAGRNLESGLEAFSIVWGDIFKPQ